MTTTRDARWAGRLPDLFRDSFIDYADGTIRFTTAAAPSRTAVA